MTERHVIHEPVVSVTPDDQVIVTQDEEHQHPDWLLAMAEQVIRTEQAIARMTTADQLFKGINHA